MLRIIARLRNFFSIKWLIIAISSTVVLIFVTHIPQEIIPDRLEIRGLDKLEHVLAYGVITLLFILSLKNSFSLLSIVILFCAISVIGAVDELTQPFVNRVASPIDWLADIIGIVAALFLFLSFKRSKRQALPNIEL